MSPNEKGWHCLTALLRRMTSKNNGAFNDLKCLHPFRTENKLKVHEKVCKNKDFCGIAFSTQNNILKPS